MGLDMYLNAGKENIMYWRKCNYIHNWFCKEFKEDIHSTIGSFYVPRSTLKKLVKECALVLEDHEKAKKLFPIPEFLAYGNFEYDWVFFENITNTHDEVLDFLTKSKKRNVRYSYDW